MNKKRIYPQWFLFAPLALYIIFFLLPSIMGVGYSFTDWNSRSVLNGTHFVGLQNYIEIFTSDKDYLNGIWHTLMFNVVSNIVKLIPALLIAIMLQEGLRGQGFYRTVMYLPSILPFVIIGLIFKSILNYNTGLLNGALEMLHLGFLKQKWLSDLNVVWKSIVGVDAWRGIGYVMTIFLAGLNTIPKSYYEAAQIDGAGKMAQMRFVVLPCILSTIVIMLITRIGSLLSIGYEKVLLLYNPHTYVTADVVSTFAQRYGLEGAAKGLATAAEMMNNIIGMLLVIGANTIARKASDVSLY